MPDFVGFLNTNRSETGVQKKQKKTNILVEVEIEKES